MIYRLWRWSRLSARSVLLSFAQRCPPDTRTPKFLSPFPRTVIQDPATAHRRPECKFLRAFQKWIPASFEYLQIRLFIQTKCHIKISVIQNKSEPLTDRYKVRICPFWWERVDSNHRSRRQQIYSLPPLATRELSHIQLELVDGLEPPTC